MAGIDAGEGAAAAPPPELSPQQRIEQKLILYGVPEEQLQGHQEGLVRYMEEHKEQIPDIVKHILSAGTDFSEARKASKKDANSSSNGDVYSESLSWLQWLMFKNEPGAMLDDLERSNAGERAVCGSVWGHNDVAYRCRTCESDPTCAICVPCFQNGNHKDHDYSIMYTGGGCCDCGDATAWKREGFCSRHKGAEQIKPLPEELARSVGPILDALLQFWKEALCLLQPPPAKGGDSSSCKRIAEELTTSISSMLLEFCTRSENLLSFLSLRIREFPDMLDALIRSDRFLDKKVARKLHEFLLKLISDPAFKYEFAKVFIRYYPITFEEVIKGCNDSLLEDYPLMTTFSVQIFTVPTLTPRLVREVDLLGVLLGCLTDLFLSCIGEDGRLQTNKWGNLFDASIRLLDDTRYVLSHEEVSKHVAYERPDLTRSWIKLLSLVQGMDPQKRVTSIHAEDENEHLSAPFVLGHYLGIVQNRMMRGSFSPPDQHESTDVTVCSTAIKGVESAENQRHAKVGRVSQESFVSNLSSRDSSLCSGLPSPAAWLILQCLKAIESWLWLENDIALRSKMSSLDASSSDSHNFIASLEDPLSSLKGSSSNTKIGIKINEGSQTDCTADYYEASSSPVQGQGNRMQIDQEGMPPVSKSTGKGKMHDGSNTTDVQLRPEDAVTYTLTDGSILYAHPDSRIEELGILNTREWPHVVFDVSSQETSSHIPLHRMLSLLLRKAMKKCFGEDGHSDVQSNEFFSQILRGCEPYGFASIVMEHPLRVRVFCAQVRAGMWRKNGDAAILSAEWYRSVQWIEQGLESDLFLLQCCAALSSPESFVRTIQERFGLSSYTDLGLAEQNEFESVLMQEMLTFLIQLVKERRFCGLSTADNLRRELIYKLAIGDATHSQIVKSLPRDLSSSDQLQNVLDSLAAYSNPSGMKQGKYVLRKSCWKELDLYHPRWNSRELQIAEERYYRFCKISALNAQLPRWTHVFNPLRSISNIATSKAVLQIVRAVLFYAVYSDASSASRAPDNVLVTGLHLLWLALDICESERQIHAGQYGMNVVQHDDESWVVLSSAEEAFPILTYSTELVSPVSDKVKKESMLTLLVSLMHKYKEENDATFSGSKYCNIPSLIEILLKKFAKLSKECMVTLRQMAPQIVPSTPDHTSTKESLGTSDSMEKKAKARQRQAAIMAKMRAEQSKFAESMKSSENEGHDVTMLETDVSSSTGVVSEESLPVCSLCRESDSKSPLCYLILLQKSRLATFVEMGNPSWENPAQVNKIVSVKREDSTDSSASGSSTSEELVNDTAVEPSFDIDNMEVDAFLDFSNEQHPLIRYISSFPTGHSNSNADENVSLEAIEADIYSSILNDLFGSSNAHIQDSDKMLPSNTSNITVDTKRTRSPKRSVLGTYVSCLSAKHRHSSLYDVASKSSASVTTRNRFGPVDCDGIHISSCGHAVHQECHDRYLFSLKQRYVRRLGFEGGHIVDPDLGELLCPVCRRFANSILPASSDFSGKTSRMVRPFVQTLIPQVVTTTSDVNRNCLQFPRALSLLESAGKIVGESKFLKAISGKLNETTNPALDPCIRRLAMLYYPRSHSSFSPSKRLNPSLFLWDTLRYSLVSTEIASRGRMSSHSAESKSCLESLRGELNSSSGFILSLLFHAAHAARNLNCLEVLLRFEGIQLLAGSICSCISGYKDILNATKRKGSLPSMIDPASEGGLFPDIQFWKQCADPVLAQDPFSSLMSALFCLPVQFLSSAEFFIPFVHLFYVVCAIQALITCYGEETFDRSNFNDCLLNDVCKTMSGFDVAREYFVSKYIDPSCHPKDMVRRLTYPYLRRCALLWELLRSSATSPLYDGSNIWEGSHLYLSNSTQDGSSSLAMELNGLRELEDLFQIQSLDLILQDESVHMLALKWSQHFCEDYNPRKYRGTLFSTPAVPFRLMQLPDVYQVLLERYVKMQCPDCGSVPDEPALCLLCGKLCSPSWKPCCRSGKCQNHALQCGAGIGIFLLVRKTTILLQRSARLAFWPSLYLDAFGEEDHEMQRGKPLYLSQERYTALTYLVASHSLDRTSEVLRQTTISFYD